MEKENKQSQEYDLTEVNAMVLADLRQSVIIVSLLANLALFVTWLVVLTA